jgi:hypothetical protein
MSQMENEKKCFVGTIQEMLELLQKSVESWSDLDKALLKASIQGRLSADTSERIQ